MKKKNLYRILISILIIFIFFIPQIQKSYGTDIIKEAQDWFNEGATGGTKIMDPKTVGTALAPISQILFWAGVITLFITGSVMGIKYIVASAEEQGKLKGQLIGLVVSAVVILGAYKIWELAYNFMNEVIKTIK